MHFIDMLNCFKSSRKSSKPAKGSRPSMSWKPPVKSHHHNAHENMATSSGSSTKLTPAGLCALAHWSMYGQPGASPENRVQKSDWRSTHAFKSPHSASWNITLAAGQLERLLLGFRPREMEDKWFVYAEGPDGEGKVVVRFYRSWTGFLLAEMEIKTGRKEVGAKVVGITWEESQVVVRGQKERDAKGTVREVCRWVLGVDLPAANAK